MLDNSIVIRLTRTSVLHQIETYITNESFMPSIHSNSTDIKTLTDKETEELFNSLGELISFKSIANSIHTDSREQRCSKGVVSLHCGSTKVIKHGKKNDV